MMKLVENAKETAIFIINQTEIAMISAWIAPKQLDIAMIQTWIALI